jgi:hypothetical protein
MSRRTGNNYSGPRWLYGSKEKPRPSISSEPSGKSWSGSSRSRLHVGDTVESAASGTGQPRIHGEIVQIDRDRALVRLQSGQERWRSTSNLRVKS